MTQTREKYKYGKAEGAGYGVENPFTNYEHVCEMIAQRCITFRLILFTYFVAVHTSK